MWLFGVKCYFCMHLNPYLISHTAMIHRYQIPTDNIQWCPGLGNHGYESSDTAVQKKKVLFRWPFVPTKAIFHRTSCSLSLPNPLPLSPLSPSDIFLKYSESWLLVFIRTY